MEDAERTGSIVFMFRIENNKKEMTSSLAYSVESSVQTHILNMI